jgi:hypothetical protein
MANDRCERCWGRGGLEEHSVEDMRPSLLCRACREAAPRDPLAFREVFLRFASTKEMLTHLDSRDEDEAVRKLCNERKLDYKTMIRAISSHGRGTSPGLAFEEFTRPFGYETHDGALKVNPAEARTVGLVFEMYLEGLGIAKICEQLNHAEIPTKTGKRWQSQTIANILRNPLYCGYIRQDGALLNGKHRPIVDQDRFSQVQVEMEKRIRRPDQKRDAALFKAPSKGG